MISQNTLSTLPQITVHATFQTVCVWCQRQLETSVEAFSLKQMVTVRTGIAMLARYNEKLLSSQCHLATNKKLFSFEDYEKKSYHVLSEKFIPSCKLQLIFFLPTLLCTLPTPNNDNK